MYMIAPSIPYKLCFYIASIDGFVTDFSGPLLLFHHRGGWRNGTTLLGVNDWLVWFKLIYTP